MEIVLTLLTGFVESASIDSDGKVDDLDRALGVVSSDDGTDLLEGDLSLCSDVALSPMVCNSCSCEQASEADS